jgi:hypothetical protein
LLLNGYAGWGTSLLSEEVEMEEIWKDVIGFEGYYQVSNIGNVRSLDRWVTYQRIDRSVPTTRLWKGKLLKQKLNDYGYYSVHLRSSELEKEEWPTTHILVAKAFVENTDNKPTVNHKDGVKTNNHYSNLEWSTMKEQIDHAISNDLIKLRGNTIYDDDFKKKVKDYFDNNDISIKQLGKLFQISERTAGRISRGEWGDERKTPQEIIDKMRKLRKEGMTLVAIGNIVGLNFSTVHNWVKDVTIDR